MNMMRLCPSCDSERDPSEVFCQGTVNGRECGWDLSTVPMRLVGWKPTVAQAADPAPVAEAVVCTNGHPMEPGDLLCGACGADAASEASSAITEPATAEAADDEEPGASPTVIAGWRLERAVGNGSPVRQRYTAVRQSDGEEALLTLYAQGSEPDPEVYEALRTLSHDHVPDIVEIGRWHDRVFEVGEDLKGGTLADLGLLPDDKATLSSIVFEVGKALHAFSECGLRHRDLRPGAIMVRTREPLDLVITGFGSARLSTSTSSRRSRRRAIRLPRPLPAASPPPATGGASA
jgi:primosomal replication protein N''